MKGRKRAGGGKVTEFNAKGSPEMEDAKKDKDESFKKGGNVKRKRGGSVGGEAEGVRLDKRARGGRVGGNVGVGRGRSPFSSGGHFTHPGASKGGHESESVSG